MVFRMPRPEDNNPYAAQAAVDRARERASDFHHERTLTHDVAYLLGLAAKLPGRLLRRLRGAQPDAGDDEASLHR